MISQSQCDRILTRLRQGPATSWQLQQLGICCHTRRIHELRKQYEITKSEQWLSGRRVVTYRLEDAANVQCVPLRSNGRFAVICEECGTAFESAYKRSRFCNNSCRARRWKRIAGAA